MIHPADSMRLPALAPPSDSILDVLVGVLESLHDPSIAKPSRAVSMAALTICEEVVLHLRTIIGKGGVADVEIVGGDVAASVAAEPSTGPSRLAPSPPAPSLPPMPAESAAPSPAGQSASPPPAAAVAAAASAPLASAPVASAPAASAPAASAPAADTPQQRPKRLSQRNRARLRRRQMAEQAEQPLSAPQAIRQEQNFRQSLWNHGWQMAPQRPDTCIAIQPADSFVDSMWNTGWQMVPVMTVPEWQYHHGQYQHAVESLAESSLPAPRPEDQLSTWQGRLATLLHRWLRQHRWQHAQRIWTEAMRAATQRRAEGGGGNIDAEGRSGSEVQVGSDTAGAACAFGTV